MGYLAERVSYLKGLADGMKLGDDTNEARLLKAMIDLLDDISISVEDLEAEQEELQDFVNDLDSDLGDLEEYVCGDDEEYDYDEIECPSCHATISLDDAALNDDCTAITCPACGEEFELDWEECDCGCCGEEDDDCDCCDHDDE